MPEGPEVDLDKIYEQASIQIREFVDEKHKEGELRKEIEEIRFGLKALKILFVMDESIGSTDAVEEKITNIENVKSVEVTDVRRAIG